MLNRGNRKSVVFHEASDYVAFINLMAKAQQRLDLPMFSACLMPNHVHLVVRPADAADIARWMQWLFTTHARHYHEKYGTTGHVWQGRYKSVLVQNDHYLLTVIRYVERNALRARLVSRAEDWRWGSLNWRLRRDSTLALTQPAVELPSYWVEYVNQPQTAAELDAIRTSVNRQRPFGDPDWVERRAREAGLEQSLVSVGRPRRRRSGTIC
ncbi:MAG TPA: transposase [Steroidobacteraceae bacterium]|nr:transposase [Steroidobacteraceae bacterium]